MSSRNGGNDDDTSYALTLYEKKTLSETRNFTKKCGNKIGEDKKDFAAKSVLGLWWDAKGFFNCSDVADVTAHMEKYKKFYEEIDTFSAQVEKGDPKSYERLLDIYKKLEEVEIKAKRDVENNQSSAVCRMLREFLDKKYNLDHNLKKVECIVLKQKMHDVEQTCKSSKDAVRLMSERMDELIEANRTIRVENDKQLKQVLEEAEERSEARILEMRKQNDELRLEADKRSEVIRRESDEKLNKLIEENHSIKEIIEIMRKEKEELALEAEKRSEAISRECGEKLDKLIKENHGMKEMVDIMRKEKEELSSDAEKRSEAIRQESNEKLKHVLKDAEERSEARLRKMKEESDKLRLEAEMIRRESDEKLKQAVEEANRKSEARMQEMAEQNRASLQKMMKMLEAMNLP